MDDIPILLFSIVIPTHDTRDLVLRCLESLDASPVPGGLEVILVDDASRDGMAEAVGQRHPEVMVLRNETPQRFTRSANLGLAGARLHYPDGSAQWSGGREPSLAWFFALASGLPALLARLPLYRRLKPLDSQGPARVDWVTGAAMAFRRAVWEAAGPLDEGFRFYAQDLDFCLRA